MIIKVRLTVEIEVTERTTPDDMRLLIETTCHEALEEAGLYPLALVATAAVPGRSTN